MNIKHILLALSTALLGTNLSAQPILSPGNIQTVKITGQEVSIKTKNAWASLSVYSPSIIRLRLDKKPLGREFSYAVVGKPVKTNVKISQDAAQITILTDSLKAVITKTPFSVAYLTLDGKVINADETGLTTSWAGDEVTAYKKIMPRERFIGLGEKTGNLDRAGNAYTNWNEDNFGYAVNKDPLYSSIPFYIGLHDNMSYGIFLDNTFQTDFNFGASNNRFSSFSAKGGEMNYYFIYHKRVADIITSYTALTGRMKMPPLWSLGYQQNRYSYYPDSEVLHIANTLREKKIPADGITLDIHYMDKYQLFTWDKTRFPNPKGLSDQLDKLGFKLTVIVDPGIKVEKGAKAYESGLEKDIFIKYSDNTNYTGQVWPGWCNFADFTSEKGRSWWRDQVKFFADNGVKGIWNDMNEISTWGQKMPSNVLFDYDGAKTNHLQAHNVYGLEMARASFEGAKEHSNERPFILTRSGYAGLQRYTAIWTGDNRAEDNHMILGVRLMNSLGLSGVPFTGMDIGGFTGGASTALYTKWMQIGAFIPYFRNHTQLNSKSSEPWTYGEDALATTRNFINLRYKLLPYIYSTFYEASQNGLPVMRSLAIDYSFNNKIYQPAYQNQYLFGKAFLVSPFESTKEFGKIYLPEGTWYDLYTDEKVKGDQELVKPLSVSRLPVYVKGGSIIPMQSLVQSTAELPSDTLSLHVYKGDQLNSFLFYEDDGKSYNYENNESSRRMLTFDPANSAIVIGETLGTFTSKVRYIKLILHGFDGLQQLKMGNEGSNSLDLKASAFRMVPSNRSIDPTEASGRTGENNNTLE
ncbi:MAG: glycoside hydrolase family 31 protein, partial [Cytophagaceae bacterium]